LAIWLFLYLALLALCFKGNMSTKKSLLVSGLPQLIIAGFLALIGWLNGVWLGISAFILLISVIGLFFDND